MFLICLQNLITSSQLIYLFKGVFILVWHIQDESVLENMESLTFIFIHSVLTDFFQALYCCRKFVSLAQLYRYYNRNSSSKKTSGRTYPPLRRIPATRLLTHFVFCSFYLSDTLLNRCVYHKCTFSKSEQPYIHRNFNRTCDFRN